MGKKWFLVSGSDKVVIIPGRDLFPPEIETLPHARIAASIDGWIVDQQSRRCVVEVFEAVAGRSLINLREAGAGELQRIIKPGLIEAFRQKTLVAVRVEHSFLKQSPATNGDKTDPTRPPAKDKPPVKSKTWIEIQLLDEEGVPIPKEHYRLELPDGEIEDDLLLKDGSARRDGIDAGMCKVSFPDLELVPKRKPPQPENPPGPKKNVTVQIKAENGTDPPPTKIPVKGSVKLKAVPSEGTGTYQWKTTSARITLANETTQVVTVTGGNAASPSINAESIELTFTPSGQAALSPVTHNATVFTAAFAQSPTQKYGYDDMDNAAGALHHVSVRKSDTTTVRVKVAGGVTGADLRFTSDDSTVADATPPAGAGAEFDLTVNGKSKDKAETTIHARAFDVGGPILASIKVNIYKEKSISAKIAKIHDSTVASTALSRPNFDVEAAEVEINKWYKPAVVAIDLTDNSATGAAVDVRFDLNGNGRLDLEPGGTSAEEAKIKAAFNPAGQKVVIVKDLAWLFQLKTAAAVGNTKIKLKDSYADFMKFILVGNTYSLGDGANEESIKVKSKSGIEVELDAALTKAHAVTDGLKYPLSGLSGNPIYVAEQGKTEAKQRETIGHENGHSLLDWLDLEASTNLMHHSSGRSDTKIRYKELPRKYDAGNDNQWEKITR